MYLIESDPALSAALADSAAPGNADLRSVAARCYEALKDRPRSSRRGAGLVDLQAQLLGKEISTEQRFLIGRYANEHRRQVSGYYVENSYLDDFGIETLRKEEFDLQGDWTLGKGSIAAGSLICTPAFLRAHRHTLSAKLTRKVKGRKIAVKGHFEFFSEGTELPRSPVIFRPLKPPSNPLKQAAVSEFNRILLDQRERNGLEAAYLQTPDYPALAREPFLELFEAFVGLMPGSIHEPGVFWRFEAFMGGPAPLEMTVKLKESATNGLGKLVYFSLLRCGDCGQPSAIEDLWMGRPAVTLDSAPISRILEVAHLRSACKPRTA